MGLGKLAQLHSSDGIAVDKTTEVAFRILRRLLAALNLEPLKICHSYLFDTVCGGRAAKIDMSKPFFSGLLSRIKTILFREVSKVAKRVELVALAVVPSR